MADQNEDLLLQEIEEDLRHEQALKLWNAYGHYLIGVAVLVVVVVAGYQGWRAWDLDRRSTWTGQLVAADILAESGKLDQAAAALAKLESEGTSGFAVLSRMKRAGLLAEQGQAMVAAEAYYGVAADANVDKSMRDLATILGTLHEINAGADNPAAIQARLQPYLDPKSVWRHSAREFLALLAIKAGESAKATEYLQAITLDAQSPGGVRSRAQELLQAIGQ
ncbi:MAG: hypothetical protein O2944_04405 [Proteobacteria bacterium]|nr:hypothetical protein [Pseudomonadota bacterium]